jgi:hypothetical protein
LLGGLIAADRAASTGIAISGGCERHHEDVAGDLGDHQPMGGRFSGIKHRVGPPDLADVLDAQAWVFEQVRGLSVDLEEVVFVEQVQIEPNRSATS